MAIMDERSISGEYLVDGVSFALLCAARDVGFRAQAHATRKELI
jgi:hypothetical protein